MDFGERLRDVVSAKRYMKVLTRDFGIDSQELSEGIMRFIDLSYNIEDKMSIHPYDSEVSVYQDRFLDTHKFNNFRLDSGTHAGTHIDSPMHLTDNKIFIGDYDVDRFCGRAIVVDVRGQNHIKLCNSDTAIIEADDIILFYTGHEVKYGTNSYYTEHPEITIELANVLIQKKVKMIGIDSPSPDKYPFNVHKVLFENGIFIVENLRNLASLLESKICEVYMFPLKVKADASMIRAVARING